MVREERILPSNEQIAPKDTQYTPEKDLSLATSKLLQSLAMPANQLTGKDFFGAIADVTAIRNGGLTLGDCIAATLGHRRDIHLALDGGADVSSRQEACIIYNPDTMPDSDIRSVRSLRFVRQPNGKVTGYEYDATINAEKEVIPQNEHDVLQQLANGLLATLAEDAAASDKEKNRRRS